MIRTSCSFSRSSSEIFVSGSFNTGSTASIISVSAVLSASTAASASVADSATVCVTDALVSLDATGSAGSFSSFLFLISSRICDTETPSFNTKPTPAAGRTADIADFADTVAVFSSAAGMFPVTNTAIAIAAAVILIL